MSALGVLILLGCGANAARGTGAGAQAAGASTRYEPWKVSSCGLLLKDSSNGAHVAWVAAYDDYGMHLETHIDAIDTLPHATDLGLRLRADGDPEREIAAQAQRGHDDSDSANLLSIILDQPQRRFVDSATRSLAVIRGDTTLIELPVDTLPDLQPVAEKCGASDPGEHVNE